MKVIIDMTGQTIGRWKVIDRAPNKGTFAMWRCICSCGTERVLAGVRLRQGRYSCGCATVRFGTAAHRILDRLAQGQARNRDIAPLIDRDSVYVRKMLNEMIGRGLVVMVQRRQGRGNPCAIYEITEAGRAELERLGPAERVWREAA